jgi:hypothetical protein
MLHLIPRHKFENIVERYKGDRYVKYFTSWQQFITLLYAQIRGKDSLRDIIAGLLAQQSIWYHIGLRKICRSTLSDANNRRDWRIYEGIFYDILSRCKEVTPKHKFKFKNPLYTLDSTVIDLCLSLFSWAKFRKRKGALKIHYLYDHSGAIPTFLVLTDAKVHDIRVAKGGEIPLSSDSIISIDRAYIDFSWLYCLERRGIYFVSRMKKGIKYEVIGQHKIYDKRGVLRDITIKLTSDQKGKEYPKELRLVEFEDPETDKIFLFLTNNFKLSPYTIAQIYKARWQIELFFKWIKQNLKIKSFLGCTKNAVLTQIWIAMCYYLLLSYIKYQTKYKYSLLELTRVLKEAIFLRVSLIDLLSLKTKDLHKIRSPSSQLTLFQSKIFIGQ